MARGDGLFARGNVDWPMDPRCQALPDNDCRWLHECLWRIAVKEHSPIISQKYTPTYLASLCRITEQRVMECVKAVASQRLIAFTQDNRIVVYGVIENHPKFTFTDDYPEHVDNPYVTEEFPVWGHMGTYGAKREEKESRRRAEGEGSSESPYGDKSEPPPDDPIYLTYPTVGTPKEWKLRKSHLDGWYRLYGKRIDVLGECRKALAWLMANPGRQKTARGMEKFLLNWLNKACDTGRGWAPLPKEQAKAEAEQLRRAQAAKAREPGQPSAVGEVLGNVLVMTATGSTNQ